MLLIFVYIYLQREFIFLVVFYFLVFCLNGYINPASRDWQTFSVKDQIVQVLCSVDHRALLLQPLNSASLVQRQPQMKCEQRSMDDT